MQYQKLKQYRFVMVLAVMLCGGYVGTASATTQSASPHYMVTETQFGSGSSLHDCSTNYCAKTSAGDTTVGNAGSTNYSAQFGANTGDSPLLEVITIGGSQNLGLIDPSTTGTSTSTIKVRDYLLNGYVLQLSGGAPNQGRHTLNTLSSPSTSHPGAEQFGVNLAANTSPRIGATPVQVPADGNTYGFVADDYKTPDLFKFVDGDTLATSNRSNGETDYTLSMILNVSNSTPGGKYDSTFSAVAVPMF